MNPLARIAYNMIAEGAEAGAKASGDDMLRAAERIAAKADDWGWKGGKPGEITAAKYWKEREAIKKMGDTAAAEVRLTALDDKVRKQFAKSKSPYISGKKYSWVESQGPEYMMGLFNELENANVPRKWTGKLVSSMLETDPPHLLPTYLAKPMETMSDSARKLYVELYPRISKYFKEDDWAGNWDDWYENIVDTTADVARNVDSMPAGQRETFMSLLPEWTESLEDLVFAVKELS